MDGWVDGWMDIGHREELSDRCMNGWKEGLKEGWRKKGKKMRYLKKIKKRKTSEDKERKKCGGSRDEGDHEFYCAVNTHQARLRENGVNLSNASRNITVLHLLSL